MILLDTDHLSALKYRDTERARRLLARLVAAVGEVTGTTVVNVEEQLPGWLAAIAKEKLPRRQITPYRELAGLFEFLRPFHIALFDEAAAKVLEGFGSIHIGTMDKKIAAIAIANNALLLTANRKDFEQIPGLRFENWMDEPPTTTPAP
jgi:tRNA(fMet)-specific endonuclease VapC